MQHDKRKKKFDTQKLKANILVLERRILAYGNLLLNPVYFDFLAGLLIEEFNMLFDIVCKGTVKRFYNKAIEFLVFLIICCHSLHLKVMAYMLDLTKSTVLRIFVGWTVFLETLFDELDMKPSECYLLKNNARYICKNRPWNYGH